MNSILSLLTPHTRAQKIPRMISLEFAAARNAVREYLKSEPIFSATKKFIADNLEEGTPAQVESMARTFNDRVTAIADRCFLAAKEQEIDIDLTDSAPIAEVVELFKAEISACLQIKRKRNKNAKITTSLLNVCSDALYQKHHP